jgi:hypothetical protein
MPYTKAIVAPLYGLLAKPYGTPDLSSGSGVAIAHGGAPFISAYPWVDGVGFGTKYANPGVAVTGTGNGVAFTPNADTIFIAHDVSPFLNAYPWTSSGFGTKFANMASLPANNQSGVAVRSLASSANHHIGGSQEASSPFQNIYRFSKTGAGWGTRFSNPATLPAGSANCIDFSTDGLVVGIGHNTTPFLSVYPWSDSGYGTKYANPGTLPDTNGVGIRFTPLGGALAVTQLAAPATPTGINAYAWTNGAGFGTKYADPLYPPGFPGGSTPSFNVNLPLQNNAIMHGSALSAFGGLHGWKWTDSSGFGNRYTLNFPFAFNVIGLAWNDIGTTLFLAHATSTPFMRAISWTQNLGLGSEYSNPATLPTSSGNAVAIAA